jgi:hypothetical protein
LGRNGKEKGAIAVGKRSHCRSKPSRIAQHINHPCIPLLPVPAFQCPVANVKAAFPDLVTYSLQVFWEDSSLGLGRFPYLEATFHRKTASNTCDRELHHQGGVAF